jgi:hypothetical protein
MDSITCREHQFAEMVIYILLSVVSTIPFSFSFYCYGTYILGDLLDVSLVFVVTKFIQKSELVVHIFRYISCVCAYIGAQLFFNY